MDHTASNDIQTRPASGQLAFGQPAELSRMSFGEMALQAACARASVGLVAVKGVRYVPVRLRRKG